MADFRSGRCPAGKTVTFTVAGIAIGGEVAKAEGPVTRGEGYAFKEVVCSAAGEERNAARVFDLARADVAGFETYAYKIRGMFDSSEDKATLEDILDGLFRIAGADGVYDPNELQFLASVSNIFSIPESCFDQLRARHDPSVGGDPYKLLGVTRDTPMSEIKQAWRNYVRETHPDRMMARGVPEEAVRMATERLALLNTAYERIRAEHRPL